MGTPEPSANPKHSRLHGRDEMNLAEFPITLLTDRAPAGQKTLVFRDGEQTLTVTGSDAFGLPTAVDADVIVALIHLTKQANNFTDPNVSFTRYGLIRLLGWPLKGSSYQRLTQSLKCWTGVTLNYEKAWWDNKAKRKIDATFHILETVIISESMLADDDDRSSPVEQSTSSFTWNKRFFQSCRADNLKRLDLNTYFSLRSSISKRMYRFLDKRFFLRSSWTFDLHEFAYDHIGMGRNYSDNGKLKEKLAPAIKELEDIGYIEPMCSKARYVQVSRGVWTVTFAKRIEGEVDPQLESPSEPTGWEKELRARGITASKAKSIVTGYSAEHIERQVEYVDFIQERHPGAIRNRAGYLRRAIEEDYAAPPGFVGKAEKAERDAIEKAERRAGSEEAKRRADAAAREQAAQVRIAAHLDSLSMAEIEELDRKILADPKVKVSYGRQFPGLQRLYLELLRKAHVRVELNLPEPLEN